MRKKLAIWAFIAVLAAVGLTACGDDDDSGDGTSGDTAAVTEWPGATIDVGTKKIEVPEGTAPKIGVFTSTGNSYEEAINESISETAEALGAEVTLFDAGLTPQTQFNQVQNALQSGRFNAMIVQAYDTNQMCDPLSQEAPDKDVVVVAITDPLCGRDLKPWGEKTSWQPGTLSVVDAVFTPTYYEAWAKAATEIDPPEGKTYALLIGPPLIPSSINMTNVLESTPGVEIAAIVNGDYTTADAFTKTQNLLQANPDLDGIYSVFSDMTRGAVQAVKAAGMEDQIEIFDLGAATYSVEAIRAGDVTMTVPYGPREVGEAAVQSLVDAFSGKDTGRLFPAVPEGTPTEPLVITKENADSFQPSY